MLGALLLLGALTAVGGPAAPAAAQQEPLDTVVPGTRVVVVGAADLRWQDIDRFSTPTLHRLAAGSALGALSVKALPAVSCPSDGWLTLGAGARAQAFGLPCSAAAAEEGELEEVAERNLETQDAAAVDALSEALRGAGLCLAGRGPGAELAGADAERACPVLLLDAPTVLGDGSERAASAAAVDALVAEVEATRSPDSTLLVVGMSGAPDADQAHLHVALAAGPRFAPGALRSASTRRAPYVQLVDVAPTVLDLVGVQQPPSMIGRPWQATGRPVEPADLAALDRRAVQAQRALVPFFVVLVGGLLVAFGVARWRRSWRLAEAVGLAGVAAVAGSYLARIVPWERAAAPLLALVAVSAVVGVAGSVVGRRLPGLLRPAAVVTGALAVLLTVDLLTGARLQLDAPAGYSPLVAGRFAGIGNVAFGVLAASTLLALAAGTAGRSHRTAALLVAVGGAAVVVADGAPPFGSDVGGVLALVPAVVLLVTLRSGRRVTWPRLAAAALGGLAVVTLFALVDFSRTPADRSHLGRFVEQVRDGTAGVVLRRKAAAIADLLFANPVTALLPLVVAAAVWLVVRPPAPLRAVFAAAPAWRHGLIAVGAASALGFALNDSGPAVPAFALLVAIPATVAVCARVQQATARRKEPAPADG